MYSAAGLLARNKEDWENVMWVDDGGVGTESMSMNAVPVELNKVTKDWWEIKRGFTFFKQMQVGILFFKTK